MPTLTYSTRLDEIRNKARQEGKDSAVVDAIIELYTFMNGGLDEANVSLKPGDTTPKGAIIAYGGATAPTGWLLCNGAAVSRSAYAALFAAIGTAYGVGDNSTTFNLPDLRGRFPLGKDNMGGSSANRVTATEADNLGQGAGVESHSHTINDHVHGVGWADRDHSHGLGGHYHCGTTACLYDVYCSHGFQHNDASWGHLHDFCTGGPSGGSDGQSTNHTHGNTGGASDRGTNAINNMPPYQTVNYIIKI